jgi:hypothetical protein
LEVRELEVRERRQKQKPRVNQLVFPLDLFLNNFVLLCEEKVEKGRIIRKRKKDRKKIRIEK